jgi:hypothetical protein
MIDRMIAVARILAILAFGAVLIATVAPAVEEQRAKAGGRLTTSDGDTVDITDAARARGIGFAPTVAEADRQWILAAIARARPEAARLIAEVDGLVIVGTFEQGGTTLGLTQGTDRGFTVDLNIAYLNGERLLDRATVVLHELGHVVDFALVKKELNEQLDAQIPRGGPCGHAVDCDRIEERFADTFAKWALHGAVSEVGAGYGIPMPASIEGWGAPLARLAFTLPT